MYLNEYTPKEEKSLKMLRGIPLEYSGRRRKGCSVKPIIVIMRNSFLSKSEPNEEK